MNVPAPAAGPSGPAPALDPAALDKLREFDPDGSHGVLVRVLTAFETSLTRMLAQLRAEAVAGDPVVVARIAHTLKASSASVGALALADACIDVDHRLRSGAPGDLDRDVARLLAEGDAALRSVGAMLRP